MIATVHAISYLQSEAISGIFRETTAVSEIPFSLICGFSEGVKYAAWSNTHGCAVTHLHADQRKVSRVTEACSDCTSGESAGSLLVERKRLTAIGLSGFGRQVPMKTESGSQVMRHGKNIYDPIPSQEQHT